MWKCCEEWEVKDEKVPVSICREFTKAYSDNC